MLESTYFCGQNGNSMYILCHQKDCNIPPYTVPVSPFSLPSQEAVLLGNSKDYRWLRRSFCSRLSWIDCSWIWSESSFQHSLLNVLAHISRASPRALGDRARVRAYQSQLCKSICLMRGKRYMLVQVLTAKLWLISSGDSLLALHLEGLLVHQDVNAIF